MRQNQAREEPKGLGSHRTEVREIHGEDFLSQRARVGRIPTKVDVLHECVGGYHELHARAWTQDGCVVSDRAHPGPIPPTRTPADGFDEPEFTELF